MSLVWALIKSGLCPRLSLFNRSVVSNSATPWTAAHQASLSSTVSWSLLKFLSTESVTPSNHLLRGNLDTQSPQGCACPERGPCEVLVGRRHLQAKQGGSRGTDPLVPSLWASSLQNCTHMKSRCLSPSVLPAEPTHLHVLQLQRAAFSCSAHMGFSLQWPLFAQSRGSRACGLL